VNQALGDALRPGPLHLLRLVRRRRHDPVFAALGAVDERIDDTLRAHLWLLTPAQMQRGIEKQGLKQQEVAAQLGVAPETISRWVNGTLIQSRAMDNLLRLFFALPVVRDALRGESQDPLLGVAVSPLLRL
jgi:hypothetical protein